MLNCRTPALEVGFEGVISVLRLVGCHVDAGVPSSVVGLHLQEVDLVHVLDVVGV